MAARSQRTASPVLALLTLLTSLSLLAAPAVAQRAPKLPKPGAPAKVLFVGNSYTFYHDLPAMVRALGAADEPARVVTTDLIAPGGCTLARHWSADGERAPTRVIKELRPDFVVLQEQSRRPFTEPEQMDEAAAKFAKECKKRGAVPVWYMTWARQHEPERQDAISDQYVAVHRANGGLLAPVGRAFEAALAKAAPPVLHANDKSHPSARGTYVAACVLYATMFGGDVAEFPDRLAVTGEDGKERVLVELEPEEGDALRAAARLALAGAREPKGSKAPRRRRR